MKKLIKYDRKALKNSEGGYKLVPLTQVTMLKLSPEEQMVLLNFFGNKGSWTIGITYITEKMFSREKHQKRIKNIIEKLKKMGYITETEVEYIMNIDKIQRDYEDLKEKKKNLINSQVLEKKKKLINSQVLEKKKKLINSQVLELEKKKKNLINSQVKTLQIVRFDALINSQDNTITAQDEVSAVQAECGTLSTAQKTETSTRLVPKPITNEEEEKELNLFLPPLANALHSNDVASTSSQHHHFHFSDLPEAKDIDEKKTITNDNVKVDDKVISNDSSNDMITWNTTQGGAEVDTLKAGTSGAAIDDLNKSNVDMMRIITKGETSENNTLSEKVDEKNIIIKRNDYDNLPF